MSGLDSLTRRDAMQLAAAAALTGTVHDATASEDAGIAIIDTHVHLWDLNTFHLPWVEKGSPLARNYLPADYAKAAAGLNVVKAVYLEVDVEPSQQRLEARTISGLCHRADTPVVAAVISGRPADDGFAAYIKPLATDPVIKGVRQVLHGAGTPPGYCLGESFVRGIRLLGELGLSFDLCMRAAELEDGAKLIRACPDTRFVLDHCGNPDVYSRDLGPWKRAIASIADRPNVACKVSGIVASTKGHEWKAADLAPIINHVLDTFGPDRVIFGGDWPVCTLGAPLARWVEALREVVRDRPDVDRRKLFHDNAVRVYRLDH